MIITGHDAIHVPGRFLAACAIPIAVSAAAPVQPQNAAPHLQPVRRQSLAPVYARPNELRARPPWHVGLARDDCLNGFTDAEFPYPNDA